MRFSHRARRVVQSIAVVLSVALPLISTVPPADARIGGGISSGSRGARTFSAPPSTSTSPGAAQPFNRTFTQPGSPGIGSATGGGFFNRPGGGMLRGGGLFGGVGGLSSLFGLIIQIGLIVFVVRMAMSWWQRRTAPAYADGPGGGLGGASAYRAGSGFGPGSGGAPLEILPADYEAFERLLGDIQAAWSNEDVAKLHTMATPEMVSYFN